MAAEQTIASDTVQELVGSAHGDLGRVEELIGRYPGLVNAAWDWGGGDWETALGAAAHMGRRDIARFLIAHGARLDLLAAAMLGEVGIVRSILSAFPDMRSALGPHGIPLAEHARAGEAAGVLVLLCEGQSEGEA